LLVIFGTDLYKEQELKEMNGFYFISTHNIIMSVQIRNKTLRNMMMNFQMMMKKSQQREEAKQNMLED